MSQLLPLVFFLFLVLIINGRAQPQPLSTNKQRKPSNNSNISAGFVFGDSTVDPGNNNYVRTAFRSNFPPYGRDFPNHIPTGRFTNGRLVTDFLVSYVGIKEYMPAYLDPSLSVEELMTGVSFASAGSGLDPLTPSLSGVISMQSQLEYFKEYKKGLEQAIGKKRTNNIIKKAVFVISAGTNDFVVNYFGPPIRRQSYTISGYQKFLIQQLQQFIQDLLDQGAQAIVIVGLPPIGCLPIVITVNSDNAFQKRGCIENLSSIARDFNGMLQNKLKAMQKSGAKIIYADIFNPFNDIIQEPGKFGFNDVNTGCCGTGFIEAAVLCNPYSVVCSDASKYAFWDAVHPTERAYYLLFEALRNTIDQFLREIS